MTLQVKLTEAFRAKASQDSSALDMLQKVVFRNLGSGVGVVLCASLDACRSLLGAG